MGKLIAILIIISFSSCGVVGNEEDLTIPLNTTLEVVEYFDKNGNQVDLNKGEPLTLRFDDTGEVEGRADCNTFVGEYDIQENRVLNIKKIFATEIACEKPSFGSDYIENLNAVTSYTNKDGKLILNYDRNGKLIFLERLE